MNPDKSDKWGVLALFPFVYYGFAASYSCFRIFTLGDYERKEGRWGSFKIELMILGVAACLAFMSYLIGLGLLKTVIQRLSSQTLTLIMMTSAFLCVVAFYVIDGIIDGITDSYITPVYIILGFNLGGLLLIPALVSASLVKIGQGCLARRQSIQR